MLGTGCCLTHSLAVGNYDNNKAYIDVTDKEMIPDINSESSSLHGTC